MDPNSSLQSHVVLGQQAFNPKEEVASLVTFNAGGIEFKLIPDPNHKDDENRVLVDFVFKGVNQRVPACKPKGSTWDAAKTKELGGLLMKGLEVIAHSKSENLETHLKTRSYVHETSDKIVVISSENQQSKVMTLTATNVHDFAATMLDVLPSEELDQTDEIGLKQRQAFRDLAFGINEESETDNSLNSRVKSLERSVNLYQKGIGKLTSKEFTNYVTKHLAKIGPSVSMSVSEEGMELKANTGERLYSYRASAGTKGKDKLRDVISVFDQLQKTNRVERLDFESPDSPNLVLALKPLKIKKRDKKAKETHERYVSTKENLPIHYAQVRVAEQELKKLDHLTLPLQVKEHVGFRNFQRALTELRSTEETFTKDMAEYEQTLRQLRLHTKKKEKQEAIDLLLNELDNFKKFGGLFNSLLEEKPEEKINSQILSVINVFSSLEMKQQINGFTRVSMEKQNGSRVKAQEIVAKMMVKHDVPPGSKLTGEGIAKAFLGSQDIKPIQRAPRYALLVKEMLNNVELMLKVPDLQKKEEELLGLCKKSLESVLGLCKGYADCVTNGFEIATDK